MDKIVLIFLPSSLIQLLGRSIDLSFLLAQRMNKILRENLEFLLERFESQDICHVVVSKGGLRSWDSIQLFTSINFFTMHHTLFDYQLNRTEQKVFTPTLNLMNFRAGMRMQELQRLVDILKATHELLSEHLTLDSFTLILSEVMENISLVSFSGRLASQV